MPDQILLTESEAADRLRLSTRTLRSARRDGVLRCILIGRAVRYTVADLESFVDQLRQVQPPCPSPKPTRARSAPKRGGVVISFSDRNARR